MRPSPLRSGFGTAKEIAFGPNADETSFLVDYRQSKCSIPSGLKDKLGSPLSVDPHQVVL
jgi:hypothetical protein